jgi:hypothetical protein
VAVLDCGLCLISFLSVQSLNKKYGCNVPLLLMNSFNTHDDTQKVPPSLCFCLHKFDDLLALVLTCLPLTFSFSLLWRLLRSTPTPTLKFTLSIRFTSCFCYTSTLLILIMWHYLHDKQCQLIDLHSILQSQYPRIVTEDFSPLPSKGNAGKDGWLVSFFRLL